MLASRSSSLIKVLATIAERRWNTKEEGHTIEILEPSCEGRGLVEEYGERWAGKKNVSIRCHLKLLLE